MFTSALMERALSCALAAVTSGDQQTPAKTTLNHEVRDLILRV
jgi:hypothetical protein